MGDFRVHLHKLFKSDIWIFILFAAISLIFLMPFLSNIHRLGILDWDGRFAYSAIPRDTIIEYHQFPLWNPYVCGGVPLLAHPESSFLSPFFIFILLFGEVIGLKILVLLHLFIGLAGMFLLSRYLGLGRAASFFSSIVFMLSSHYAVHIAVGHPTDYLMMAYIPFALLFYLKTVDSRSLKKKFVNATLSSLSILLMFLYGSTYLMVFLALFLFFYSSILSIFKKDIKPLAICLVILVAAALLGSVKLFPVLGLLNDNNLDYEAGWEGNNVHILLTSILSRNQRYDRNLGTYYGWWEYSAYIGFIPLVLAFFGLYSAIRRKKKKEKKDEKVRKKSLIPLILSSVPFLLIYFGNALPVNLWELLHVIPIISFFRVPSRAILVILLCTAILGGEGMDSIISCLGSSRLKRKKHPLAYAIPVLVILAVMTSVIVDMTLVSRPALSAAFPFKEYEPEAKSGERGTFYSTERGFSSYYGNLSYSQIYPDFLNGKGDMNHVDCVRERIYEPFYYSALPIESHRYRGEAYLEDNNGNVTIDYFSPNRIRVIADVVAPDKLVLNQNYYYGWRSDIGRAEAYNGLVFVPVSEGHHVAEFYYLPYIFLFGIFFEGIAIVAWAMAFLWIKRKEDGNR